MATTVNYKGSVLTTVNNQTRTLKTAGKYMEGDLTLVDVTGGATAISVVDTLDPGGGTIRTITAVDISNDTVAADNLLQGYTAHDSQGNLVNGTAVAGEVNNQNKTVSPSLSQQTITADAGYTGLGTVTVNAMPTGSAGTPATTISVTPTISVNSSGLITASASGSQSITPTVNAGYVSSGTAGTVTVNGSNTSQLTTQAAQTLYPSTSDQTISSGRYLTGTQTIKAVTTSNLTADNIKSGVTVTVGDSADADRILSITGTYSGGGSDDIATGTLTVSSNVNTSTNTTITNTSTIGFTPTKFFFWKSARTATNNHVHQATFTTFGSYYVRTMTRYSSNALSTSGNTNNWTTQTAGYLYYNSNTVYFRSSSSYILSSGTWYWVAVK